MLNEEICRKMVRAGKYIQFFIYKYVSIVYLLNEVINEYLRK